MWCLCKSNENLTYRFDEWFPFELHWEMGLRWNLLLGPCAFCVFGIVCYLTYVMSEDKCRVTSASLDCLEDKCVQSAGKEQGSASYPVCVRATCLWPCDRDVPTRAYNQSPKSQTSVYITQYCSAWSFCLLTRMHSSRMRTVRSSSRLSRRGLPQCMLGYPPDHAHTHLPGVVSFTNSPSGPQPENNGPPPLTLGPGVELCWLLPLTLVPWADMHFSPSTFSPDRNIFNETFKILNIFVANDT